MHRTLIASLAFLAAGLATAAAETQPVVFQGETAEHKWTLKDLNPDLPSDWSGYDYLVLELKASSPQRMVLRVYTADGARNMRLHLFGGGAWIRAAIPLKYFQRPDREGFDLASLGNKFRNSFWMGVGGPYGPVSAVQALGFTMQNPVGKPTLEIRSVRLSKEDPGSEILEPKPVVDEFGQWILSDWPGKIKSLAQLKTEWAQEEKELGPGDFNYCRYGGYLGAKAKPTGFFRVEQVDGKWWFVDPDGHLFFSVSSNGMRGGGAETRTAGRESYYAALPPAGGGFTAWNMLRRFGPDWNTQWVDFAIRRLDTWGLNTIGNWSDARLWDTHKKAYIVFLRGWGMETGYMACPTCTRRSSSRSPTRSPPNSARRVKTTRTCWGTSLATNRPGRGGSRWWSIPFSNVPPAPFSGKPRRSSPKEILRSAASSLSTAPSTNSSRWSTRPSASTTPIT